MESEENKIRYPHFIFYSTDKIPWNQQLSIHASLIDVSGTHVVSIRKFYRYIDDIREMERTRTLGILPSNILPYAKKFYFCNQRIRWAFKRLWYMYMHRRSRRLIFNTECLEGNPIRYNTKNPSRRILCLWDNSSNRSYLFSITDLLGIFRACILGNEIHKPKNPYTNICFTYSQIRQIHIFFNNNMDRICREDMPILTYTRWGTTEITYDHITHSYTRYGSLHVHPPEEPMIASLLWNHIMHIQSLKDEKQELAIELRREFLRQVYYEFVTTMKDVPTTKIGYYVRMSLLNDNIESPGELLRKWHRINRRRYTIRYRPTGNHRDSE